MKVSQVAPSNFFKYFFKVSQVGEKFVPACSISNFFVASLLGNILAGKGINRAGEGVVRAGYGNKRKDHKNKIYF